MSASSPEFIRYEVSDPVATITLDRPEVLNAFHYPMLAEIRAAIEASSADPSVVGTIVTGEGRGFCAGLDASVLAATTEGRTEGRPSVTEDQLPGLFSYFTQQPKPIIAAVNGVTAGGGFVLSAMSDLRFASTAAAFTVVFSKRGLVAEHGTTWLLPRQIGLGAALDLAWSSRKIDAAEAYRIGLVERVVRARRAAAGRPGLHRGPRRQRLAGLDRRHQADGVRPCRPGAAPGTAARRRDDVGSRRPRRRPGGCPVAARAPSADLRAHRSLVPLCDGDLSRRTGFERRSQSAQVGSLDARAQCSPHGGSLRWIAASRWIR